MTTPTIEIPGTNVTLVASMLPNLTDQELVQYCVSSTDPVIQELVSRLQVTLDVMDGF